MPRFLAPIACLLLGASTLRSTHASTSLVGTWELVSRVDHDSTGRVLAAVGLGETPTGYLIYDAAGHVAVQLSARQRPSIVCDTAPTVGEPNNNANISGYAAYFGRYEIDASKGTVTHILDGTLSPADIGKRLVRRFRVVGDTLTIDFEPNPNRTREFVWHRVSG